MWLYDSMVYMYALSLLFYFSDFVEKNRKAKQLGTGLLVFVWGLQTASFILRLVERADLPVVSMFETLFFISWLIVTVAIVINLVLRIDLLVLFVNVAGFGTLALSLFSDRHAAPTIAGWDIQDELLFIHVSLAMIGYAAFLISAVMAGMYVYLHHRLKRKKWSRQMRQMPDLGTIDRISFRFVIIGAPCLVLSLTLGIDWVILTGQFHLMADPKVINSFLILAAYAFYLVQRNRHATARQLAVWNLAAFAFVVANFIVSNYLSSFHQWIWM